MSSATVRVWGDCEQGMAHQGDLSRSCGVNVCWQCGEHQRLVRCFCGWAAGGGNGYTQLIEWGEQIEEDY